MDNSKIEAGLLIIALALGVLVFKWPFLQDIALLIDWMIFLTFVNKIPSLLDKFYKTKTFSKRKGFRCTVLISFLALYALFAYHIRGVFLPFSHLESPVGSEFSRLTPTLIFSALFIALIMSALVSLEIRKSPNLLQTIFRRMGSKDEFADDKYEMEKSRIGRLSGYYTAGLFVELIALMLLGFWFVSMVFAPLFLMFTILWLIHGMISWRRKNLLRNFADTLLESDEKVETTFGWDSFLRPLFSGTGGGSIALLILINFGILSIFLVCFLPYLVYMLLFWILTCCWYLLFMLICLTSRLSTEIELLRKISQSVHAFSLPSQGDLVIFLISVNAFVFSILTIYPSYLNENSKLFFYGFSVLTNVAAIYSVIVYVKRKVYRRRESVRVSNFNYDRFRLLSISFLVSLMLSVLSKTHIFIELVLTVAIFQVFHIDLKPKLEKWRPVSYSIVYAVVHSGTIIFVGISVSVVKLNGILFLEDMTTPLLALGVVFFFITMLVSYHAHKIRFRRLNESARDFKS